MRPLADLNVDDRKADDFIAAHDGAVQWWAYYSWALLRKVTETQKLLRTNCARMWKRSPKRFRGAYTAILHYKGKSNDWMLALAIEMGMPPPQHIVYADDEENVIDAETAIDSVDDVLVIDDIAYTGKQVRLELPVRPFPMRKRDVTRIHLVIPFMTKEAEAAPLSNFISSGYVEKLYPGINAWKVSSGYRLPPIWSAGIMNISSTSSRTVYRQSPTKNWSRTVAEYRRQSLIQVSHLINMADPNKNKNLLLRGMGKPYSAEYVQSVRTYLIAHWDTERSLLTLQLSVSRNSLIKLIRTCWPSIHARWIKTGCDGLPDR